MTLGMPFYGRDNGHAFTEGDDDNFVYFKDINIVDYGMMLLAALMLYVVVFTFKKNKFDRIEGVIFFIIYVSYILYLLLR